MFSVRKDVSQSGSVTTEQMAAVFALVTVGQIRPGKDGKYPGDKVQEPIGGCQVAVVLFTAQEQDISCQQGRVGTGALHQEGSDGGCDRGFLCVYGCVCVCLVR